MSVQRQKLREMTPDAMRAHVVEMATNNEIILRMEAPGTGQNKAYTKGLRRVICQPITSQLRYLIALHELGHCLSEESKDARTAGNELICEAEAWAWALRTSRVDPNDRTKGMLGKYLGSYHDKWEDKVKQSRGQLTLNAPPDDSIYWKIIGWRPVKKQKVRVLP